MLYFSGEASTTSRPPSALFSLCAWPVAPFVIKIIFSLSNCFVLMHNFFFPSQFCFWFCMNYYLTLWLAKLNISMTSSCCSWTIILERMVMLSLSCKSNSKHNFPQGREYNYMHVKVNVYIYVRVCTIALLIYIHGMLATRILLSKCIIIKVYFAFPEMGNILIKILLSL